jgi:hypothetical protein
MYENNIKIKEGGMAIDMRGSTLVAVAHNAVCVCICNKETHCGGIFHFSEQPDKNDYAADLSADHIDMLSLIAQVRKNSSGKYMEASMIVPPLEDKIRSIHHTIDTDFILNSLWSYDIPIVRVIIGTAEYRCITFNTYAGTISITDISGS